MSATRDPTARLRAGLNPLLTASLGVGGGYHNQNSTPLSAVSMASPGVFSSAQTPQSAIQPYNPQQWIGSPVAPPERGHPFGEPQSSPPPPPPYSPPRAQRPVSMSFDPQAANVSAVRAPPPQAAVQRMSPDTPAASTTFAPPPGAGGRGASRDRRFGLPSFGRRRDTEQAATPSEPHPAAAPHPHTHHSPNPAPTPSRPHPYPHQTHLTLQIPQRSDSDSSQNLPPSARRAVSTPAIATPTSARSRSSSQFRWEPGMPLPPPPPGPPPSASRSQSVSHIDGNEPVVSPPTRRPPPGGVAALGPVPPTPADWVDSDHQPTGAESPNRTSLVSISDSSSHDSSNAQAESSTSTASSAGGLARARALRGEKTLRERRNESKTRCSIRHSIDASVDAQPLSDIMIPSGTGLTRRLTINKGTPRSSRSTSETPRTGEITSSSDHSHASNLTPRAPGSAQPGSAQQQPGPETPTPPFSPRLQKSQTDADTHRSIAPKALPTPPPQSRSSSSAVGSLVPAPLSPSHPISRQSAINQTPDQFSRGTIERFEAFAHKEASAVDDAERIRLFAEFFVSESRVRRERYSAAISAMGSEIFDLSRDLFRPMAPGPESTVSTATAAEFTPQSSGPRSSRESVGSATFREQGPPSSTPSSANLPMSPVGPSPGNQNWQSSNYMPSLSPILSMSVSDALDEEDSRGRPASRWWESESAGESSSRLERSRRESKYMGVPKEAREALQWVDGPEAGPSKRESSNEYPPEKSGWHDERVITPQPRNIRNSLLSLPSPHTPSMNPAHLDVSRLVTLPPPYPRHHPAVNNNHPELTQTRNSVRALSDMAEVEATKERFLVGSSKSRAEAAEAAQQRTKALRVNLQQEVSSGNIGYSEAAAIEADAKVDENAKSKELEKKDFDGFQTAVVMPLNDLLTGRITKATALFDELRGRLFVETRDSNPNMPQEEGDEQPELLETLTLLKWIFEAREMLHRAIYDLLTDRNERYREMVLTPYRLANNTEKITSATAFFAEDAQKRALAFSEEVLYRTQEFRDVVEETVVRGVEAQLGAFWDIAPPLKRVLDKIPANLHGFAVQIPAGEYEENPTYMDHPLQYLFSLLLHAEKSTYQFIESQTNLLCLLHEVREVVVAAKAKAMEQEGRDAARIAEMKNAERSRLTDDLKEKVRVVQDQWNSALGDCIGGVKEKVGGWLLETGGWDESLEDGGVGGVQI